jgi:hypothetical protein
MRSFAGPIRVSRRVRRPDSALKVAGAPKDARVYGRLSAAPLASAQGALAPQRQREGPWEPSEPSLTHAPAEVLAIGLVPESAANLLPYSEMFSNALKVWLRSARHPFPTAHEFDDRPCVARPRDGVAWADARDFLGFAGCSQRIVGDTCIDAAPFAARNGDTVAKARVLEHDNAQHAVARLVDVADGSHILCKIDRAFEGFELRVRHGNNLVGSFRIKADEDGGAGLAQIGPGARASTTKAPASRALKNIVPVLLALWGMALKREVLMTARDPLEALREAVATSVAVNGSDDRASSR